MMGMVSALGLKPCPETAVKLDLSAIALASRVGDPFTAALARHGARLFAQLMHSRRPQPRHWDIVLAEHTWQLALPAVLLTVTRLDHPVATWQQYVRLSLSASISAADVFRRNLHRGASAIPALA